MNQNPASFIEFFLNAFHVVFEKGEEYMIALIRETSKQEGLTLEARDRMQWFCRQELSHARAHENYWKALEDAFALERFSKFCSSVGNFMLKHFPLGLNLAIASAIEHFTAVFSELVLGQGLFSDLPDAKTVKLLQWHCREEIEHRDVVYDAMKNKTGGGILIRVIGLMGAVSVLTLLGAIGTTTLLARHGRLFRLKTIKESFSFFLLDPALLLRTFAPVLIFLKPNYHPLQMKLDHLLTQAPPVRPKKYKTLFELREFFLALAMVVASAALAIRSAEVGPLAFIGITLVQIVLILQIVLLYHDCLHAALFRSDRVHRLVGRWIGAYCLWPFHYLRESHLTHHRHAGHEERDTEILHFTPEMAEKSRVVRMLAWISATPLAPIFFTPALQGYHFSKWFAGISRDKFIQYAVDSLCMVAFWGVLSFWTHGHFIQILSLGYLLPGVLAMAVMYGFAKPLHTQMFTLGAGETNVKKRTFFVARSFESNWMVRMLICNLNYHIEHHLHPQAHRWELRELSLRVRASHRKFTSEQGLPYAFHMSYWDWYRQVQPQAARFNSIETMEQWKECNPAC